ncbi:DUF808 domain-containing protein [Pedobacter yonginense]|uniref:DUF808 domain-containing protein n=1 Tax=Pedobacter yonginense TaxID=651869 RepID=A0A317ER03_9SPHI|nr:DUF808 domain-containing protein [Pedobacter yonginense]PWS29331.1 DUF808 domain-containing protein [Pedobacter yonginense]
MASGFFAVLDDIAALMDDVAVSAKLATKKTAGILGDDLAVNAEKATGFLSSRELPVLWAITKGSFINKLIIVPVALLLSSFFPAAITVILLLGGCYLAYEGVEKVVEYFFPSATVAEVKEEKQPENEASLEQSKVKSAITTDFILSVEIVIIALGSVSGQDLLLQILTVSIVALVATVGVYGIVALIVRMDDGGHALIKKSNGKGIVNSVGTLLVKALPLVIRMLSFFGTVALILVAGGIFVHNLNFLHELMPNIPSMIYEFLIGLLVGLVALGLFALVKLLLGFFRK